MPSILIGRDQQAGAAHKNMPLVDFVRAETIRTGGKLELTIAVVADGGEPSAPNRATSVAVKTIFEHCQRSRERDVAAIVGQAIEAARRAAYGANSQGSRAALTVVVIYSGRLYAAQAGEKTSVYLVRDGMAHEQATAAGVRLQPGDQIVIGSDGLFGKLNDLRELAVVEQYAAPLEAARHLSSLAMGRNVNDNVSVVVLRFGRKSAVRLSTITVALASAAFVLMLVGLGVWQFYPEWAGLSETSCANTVGVLKALRGNVTSTAPGRLEAEKPICTGTTITNAGSNTAYIRLEPASMTNAGIDIYLGSAAEVQLVFDNGSTRAVVLKGRLLLKSDGGRLYPVQAGKMLITLSVDAKSAVLGIIASGNEQPTFTCFTCGTAPFSDEKVLNDWRTFCGCEIK